MIENLSSKIDSLSGHPPRSENPIVDLYEPENQASTSRPTTLNELHPSQGQHKNVLSKGPSVYIFQTFFKSFRIVFVFENYCGLEDIGGNQTSPQK